MESRPIWQQHRWLGTENPSIYINALFSCLLTQYSNLWLADLWYDYIEYSEHETMTLNTLYMLWVRSYQPNQGGTFCLWSLISNFLCPPPVACAKKFWSPFSMCKKFWCPPLCLCKNNLPPHERRREKLRSPSWEKILVGRGGGLGICGPLRVVGGGV